MRVEGVDVKGGNRERGANAVSRREGKGNESRVSGQRSTGDAKQECRIDGGACKKAGNTIGAGVTRVVIALLLAVAKHSSGPDENLDSRGSQGR